MVTTTTIVHNNGSNINCWSNNDDSKDSNINGHNKNCSNNNGNNNKGSNINGHSNNDNSKDSNNLYQ